MADSPAPAEIRAARQAAGLTQSEAAACLHVTLRNWQQWEAGERRMHPALWDWFRVLAGQARLDDVRRRVGLHHLSRPGVALITQRTP